MIISQEREEDRIALNDLLAIIEIAARQYQASRDTRIGKYVQDLYTDYEALREKVIHGDYTEQDARRARVDQLLANNRKFGE